MAKHIVYTESAQEKLNKLHAQIDKQVEDYFQERKYVPGDDFIEVTASDIADISDRFKIVKYYKSTSLLQFASLLYSVAGVLLTLFGLYYNEIQNILSGDPKRLVYIAGGFTMTILSLLSFFVIRNKNIREEKERIFREIEIKNKEMNLYLPEKKLG